MIDWGRFVGSSAPLRYALLSLACACGGPLDAGGNLRDQLPFGRDNSVIVINDSVTDNWQGEYALLLANGGGSPVVGIVVSTGGMWVDLQANVAGWRDLAASARESGLSNVPDPVESESNTLERPSDDDLDATTPNDSAGARLIVAESKRVFEDTGKPVVLAVGGRLTDVADAYLIDPSVTERVVVVASAGSSFGEDGETATIGRPNGEMDPWADEIVIRRFTYVQVAAHYDQTEDVQESELEQLPDNPLGEWIASKQPQIPDNPVAADQVSVLAGGLTEFVRDFARVSPGPLGQDLPTLRADPDGKGFLITEVTGAAATKELWRQLKAF